MEKEAEFDAKLDKEAAERQADITSVREQANEDWVDILPKKKGDEKATEVAHLNRCNLLRRELKGGQVWYVFDGGPHQSDPLAPMAVISIPAWGRWFAEQAAKNPGETICFEAPNTHPDPNRNRIRQEQWHRQCKAVLSAVIDRIKQGEHWYWNGGKDDCPWHETNDEGKKVLKLTKLQQAAAA
jgi:hypothetical protein